MNRKGFTLVEIMIVVAIIALLAAIAVPNLLAARKTANDAAAKASVRSLSTAAEVYATSHSGAYPTQIATPGLVDFISSAANYCKDVAGGETTIQGFKYACTLSSSAYSFVATPVTVGTTGTETYTASTGGVLTPL